MNASEALAVLQLLADGTDPVTFKPLDVKCSINDPMVVRALFAATGVLEKQARAEKRNSRLPKNAGKPWNEEEDNELIQNFNEGKNIGELSEVHKRTIGSIRSRLLKHGILTEKSIR